MRSFKAPAVLFSDQCRSSRYPVSHSVYRRASFEAMEAGDATRVADALTTAANKSFNSVESLGEALIAREAARVELRNLTARLTYPLWVGDPLSLRGTDAADRRRRVWGGGSRGSTEHIAASMLARNVGVDPKKVNYVAFRGGLDVPPVMGSRGNRNGPMRPCSAQSNCPGRH